MIESSPTAKIRGYSEPLVPATSSQVFVFGLFAVGSNAVGVTNTKITRVQNKVIVYIGQEKLLRCYLYEVLKETNALRPASTLSADHTLK